MRQGDGEFCGHQPQMMGAKRRAVIGIEPLWDTEAPDCKHQIIQKRSCVFGEMEPRRNDIAGCIIDNGVQIGFVGTRSVPYHRSVQKIGAPQVTEIGVLE